MSFRKFDPNRDLKAAYRIWQEVRWIDGEEDEKRLDTFLTNARALVADINDEAECLVVSVPGDIRHLNSDISMSAVTAVTTSLIARKQSLASRLTAQLIAEDAEAGFEVAALGMFDQGFYNRLGFGTGPYEHYLQFDPADLSIGNRNKIPVRLGIDDFKDVYQAMLHRWRGHGGVRLFSEEHVHAEMVWTEKPFGLGFRNEKGELTHFVWGKAKNESGPFVVNALAYRDREQLLDLLGLLSGIGDQAVSVHIREPFHLQMQDFLKTPYRRYRTTANSQLGARNTANAFWQLRVNDLTKCLAGTHLPGRRTLSFNLSLTDPITPHLDSASSWQGISGDYTIHLGEECEAIEGHKPGLPLLNAGVPGISRLWLGSASATALALAGEIECTDELLGQLEQTLSLPLPKIGWDF